MLKIGQKQEIIRCVNNCGSPNRNVSELLVEGLHKMEYRGYDSAGLALHQRIILLI